MHQSQQIAVGRQLFEYIDSRSTAKVEGVYRQPTEEYTCPTRASLERQIFFREYPLCVGMTGLLPDPGAYRTHDLSGIPILLTRGEDNKIRAFLNVCRHRGSRIAETCGSSRSFVCPYHAWTYGLNGDLISRPEESSFTDAPKTLHGLTQLPALERDGLIWVSPVTNGTFNVDNHLNGLGDELRGFGLANFHHYETRILTRKLNWKLMLDTFLESYHFCVLHRDSICAIFYENLTTFDTWGPHMRLVAARRTIEKLRGLPSQEWDLLPHMVSIYVLFPNTVLVWQLDHIELWQIFPSEHTPNESSLSLSIYIPEPAITESAKRHWDKNVDLVLHVVENEDFPVGEGIQSGFYSGAQDHITFGQNEPALAHFHRTVSKITAATGG